MEDIVYKTDADIDAEHAAAIKAAKEELFKLVHPELAADAGASQTGLFELRGIITHQGASADSGHYTAFIKKEGSKDPETGKRKAAELVIDLETGISYDAGERTTSTASGFRSVAAKRIRLRGKPASMKEMPVDILAEVTAFI